MPKDGKKTKNALAQALIDEMALRPADEPTVKAVVARAQVNRQTFYYHFGTMDDLLMYACRVKVLEARDSLKSASIGDGFFLVLAQLAYDQRVVVAKVLQTKGRKWLRSVLYEYAEQACSDYLRRLCGSAIPNGNWDEAVRYCVLASASLLESWIVDETEETPEQIASQLRRGVEVHARGLLAI